MRYNTSKLISKNDLRKLSVILYALCLTCILELYDNDPSYILESIAISKKKNLIPTIFPIMLIININVIYVDNLHFLFFQIIQKSKDINWSL